MGSEGTLSKRNEPLSVFRFARTFYRTKSAHRLKTILPWMILYAMRFTLLVILRSLHFSLPFSSFFLSMHSENSGLPKTSLSMRPIFGVTPSYTRLGAGNQPPSASCLKPPNCLSNSLLRPVTGLEYLRLEMIH